VTQSNIADCVGTAATFGSRPIAHIAKKFPTIYLYKFKTDSKQAFVFLTIFFPMKIMLISLEFVDPIFSGNGIASRSLARSLLGIDGVSIFVICGRPGNMMKADYVQPLQDSDFIQSLQVSEDAVRQLSGISIPLSSWYRTDIQSSFSEFSQGAVTSAEVLAFDPDLCLVIDWTGSMSHRQLVDSGKINAPSIYFAFCCYTFLSGVSSLDQAFYCEQEKLSIDSSVLTIAICSGDEKKLKQISMSSYVRVLPPPLRNDVHDLVTNSLDSSARRKFITCCLRLHPSKNVSVFVEAIDLLKEFLVEMDLVPVLCGSAADLKYAAACRGRLRAVFPSSEIYEEFLSAKSMVDIFKSTVLNVHTAVYEPYGMTIVEAAAAGK
jgi:glycosyltransferase involved in cell wall biosynthesis